MKYKRLLSWLLTFAMIAGMLVVPAAAEEITTITQDNPSGTMTITLEVPKKTPAATDLTYTAPSDLVYSGSAKTATVTPASGVTGMGEITVKYYSDAARTAEAEPVNVGTYYVGATVAEGDQYTAGTAVLYGAGWEFAIIPSTPAAPAAPTVASATKTGITLNAVSGCEYSMDGTNWQDGTEFTGLNPGTEYTFYQRLKATANTNASDPSNAKFSTEADTYAMTITLVINRTQTITAENVTATYGDTDKSVSATTDGDGAISYAVKEGSDVIDVDAATGALTIKKVGTATVTVTAAETANYQQGTKEVTVTIGKKAATVTAADKAKTYGEDDPELTAAVEGTVGNDTINYTLSRAEGQNVGEYAITVTLGENPNYDVTATNAKFTIGKKAATVTAADKAKTYGEDDPELTAAVEGTVGNDTINYTLSRAEGENVGEYAITVTPGENPNYDVTVTNAKLTIGKKAATVTAADKAKTYGEADPELTAAVEGTVGNDTINYTLSRAEGENVGEYAITVTLGENPNYDVTVTNAKLTIGKKAATVTAADKSKTYGEDDPELTAAVEGTVGTDTINYTLSRAEGENVGEYAITVTLGENPNYDVTVTDAKLTITKKAATVTAANLSKVYGEDDPELTATVSGLVGSDTLNYTLARAEGENVGEYAITVTLGENPNYDVTALNGVFTILKKSADVTVTANNLSKVYGEDDPELTATVTGLVGSDTLNYTLARAEGENVGEYAITVTLGENPNYDVAALNGVFTITKKAATVTADDLSKVYGEDDPELTATVIGLVGEDTLAYTLSRAEGENVGEYEITVALGENPNYEITATSGKLTITKADPSYTVPEGLVAVVGWTLADVTLPEGWTWNDPAQVIEEAGAQTFPATYTPEDTDNYNIAENIDLTVTAKEMKFVDVADGSYYYDAVYWAVAHDITAGTDETHFSPNVGATRAQVVTFLWRAAGSPEPTTTECKFTDVKAGAWYEKAVLWATETGVTSGTSATTFSPDKVCTRAEIVTFLWHANGSVEPTSTECKFTDVKAGAYYEKAVLWAAESGITAGTSATTFSPNRTCTRAQIVTFLFNADKLAE